MPRKDEPLCAACDGCPVCAVNPDCCTDCTAEFGEDDTLVVAICECEGHYCGPASEDVEPEEAHGE